MGVQGERFNVVKNETVMKDQKINKKTRIILGGKCQCCPLLGT
jgi:hypothetical protein